MPVWSMTRAAAPSNVMGTAYGVIAHAVASLTVSILSPGVSWPAESQLPGTECLCVPVAGFHTP